MNHYFRIGVNFIRSRCLSQLLVVQFERVAACLGNVQCPKTIFNGCDVLVSFIYNFQRRQTFQFIRLYWNVIIFEKLIVSLNILVD